MEEKKDLFEGVPPVLHYTIWSLCDISCLSICSSVCKEWNEWLSSPSKQFQKRYQERVFLTVLSKLDFDLSNERIRRHRKVELYEAITLLNRRHLSSLIINTADYSEDKEMKIDDFKDKFDSIDSIKSIPTLPPFHSRVFRQVMHYYQTKPVSLVSLRSLDRLMAYQFAKLEVCFLFQPTQNKPRTKPKQFYYFQIQNARY